MDRTKRERIYKSITATLFVAALLCALLSVVGAAIRFPLENTRIVHQWPVALDEGWSVLGKNGETPIAEPSRPAAGGESGTLTLINTLPEREGDTVTLCFQTKNESVQVFVDDKLCYSYGGKAQLAYGFGVGAVWNLAELPASADGARLRVELTPIGGRTGLAPYSFFIGDRGSVIAHIHAETFDMIIVTLVLGIIGLAAVVIAVLGIARGNPASGWSAMYFAIFVLLAALWTAADSALLQFFIENKGACYMLFGCSFYLFCTPFALFLATMLPERAKFFRALAIVNSVNAIVRILLYMTGVMDFETGLWTLHLLMTFFIASANAIIWLPVVREGKAKLPELGLAVTAFTVISSIALVSFYINDKLDVLRCGYSSGFYVGILLFALITVRDSIHRAFILRQRAFKADFYERRAYTDELTGLMNVRGFDDKCAERLRIEPADVCCAVVDFDVNFFSQYNANNGVEAGDALLKTTAVRLGEICREGELCCRQEADHFVCFIRGESMGDIIERIRKADLMVHERMSRRMLLLSYGVAEVDDRSITPAELRNQALVAKRTVKGNYERNIAVYDVSLHKKQLREMALLSGFESALNSGEYVIFLQPKIFASNEKLGGAEALARRIAPDGSVTSAGEIIEALEQKGFVAKLDHYVLEEVCRFLRRSMDEGLTPCPVSSNFSRVHLYDPDFPDKVTRTVDKYSIPHGLVELELTETAFLAGKDILSATVRRMRERGFKVSIDDFGSGYSSLNILKDVEVDSIKLDREFLSGSDDNDRADTIIKHTLDMARSMGITTVAEGIETEEQLELMRRMGCELIQGYYYSRPVPVSEFIKKYLK